MEGVTCILTVEKTENLHLKSESCAGRRPRECADLIAAAAIGDMGALLRTPAISSTDLPSRCSCSTILICECVHRSGNPQVRAFLSDTEHAMKCPLRLAEVVAIYTSSGSVPRHRLEELGEVAGCSRPSATMQSMVSSKSKATTVVPAMLSYSLNSSE